MVASLHRMDQAIISHNIPEMEQIGLQSLQMESTAQLVLLYQLDPERYERAKYLPDLLLCGLPNLIKATIWLLLRLPNHQSSAHL